MRHPCLAPNPFAGEKLPDHPLLAPSYWCWISLIHPAWSKQKHFPAIIWLFFFTQVHKNNKGPIWKFICYFFLHDTYIYLHITYVLVYARSSGICTWTHIQIFLPLNIIKMSQTSVLKYPVKKTKQYNAIRKNEPLPSIPQININWHALLHPPPPQNPPPPSQAECMRQIGST